MYYLYDFKQGIIHKRKYFILPAVFTLIGCLSFYSMIKHELQFGNIDRDICFFDLLLYLFKGDKPAAMYPADEFHFPFMWFISQITIAFIAGRYPLSELYDGHGAYILLKGGSRFHWLQSKFLITLLNCICYYVIVFLISIVFSCFAGYRFGTELPASSSDVLLTAEKTISGLRIIMLFSLPLITAVSISFFQLLVSLITNSAVGFIAVMGLNGISVYFDDIWIIPNCSSLNRNNLFNAGNIDSAKAVILLAAAAIISYAGSQLYFKNTDII